MCSSRCEREVFLRKFCPILCQTPAQNPSRVLANKAIKVNLFLHKKDGRKKKNAKFRMVNLQRLLFFSGPFDLPLSKLWSRELPESTVLHSRSGVKATNLSSVVFSARQDLEMGTDAFNFFATLKLHFPLSRLRGLCMPGAWKERPPLR